MSTLDMLKEELRDELRTEVRDEVKSEVAKEMLIKDFELFKTDKITSVRHVLNVDMEPGLIANILNLPEDFVMSILKGENPDDRSLRDRFMRERSGGAIDPQ